MVVGAVLGSLLVAVSVAAAAYFVQRQRWRNAKFDFEAVVRQLQEAGVLNVDVPAADPRESSSSSSSGGGGGGGSRVTAFAEGIALGWVPAAEQDDPAATPLVAADGDSAPLAHPPSAEAAGTTAQPGSGMTGTLGRAGAPDAQPMRVPREIQSKCLVMINAIGNGYFGDVYDGTLDERATTGVPAYKVAIKVAKPGVEQEGGDSKASLLQEAALMAQFVHPNIVALIGVVTRRGECQVVLQFCDRGSLQDLLRQDALIPEGAATLPTDTVLKIACDVTSGMAYLAHRRFIHRDLATRNVLVAVDNTCLISDFGLSRHLHNDSAYYKVREGIALPVRWSAPEVVQDVALSRFTSASDVWSFFVLMWEVSLLAANWCNANPFVDTTPNRHVKKGDSTTDGVDRSLYRP